MPSAGEADASSPSPFSAGWFRRQWREHPERLWLAFVLLLAFALRAFRLGATSYWHDELYSVFLTEHWKSVVLKGEFVSNHPPLFTILATIWRTLGFGETAWSMRLLNVILGLCSVMAVYTVARRLLDARTALIAAFFVAISPFHVLHSQDLKEYMVLPVTGPLAVYFLYRATEENRPGLWLSYGLWAALACYSQLFAGPMLVAVNLWFVLQLRGRSNRIPGWLLSNLFGAALFLPQLGIMLGKAENIMVKATEWWLPTPDLVFGQNTVLIYLKTLAFGYWDLKPQFYIAFALYILLSATGTVVVWRRSWRVGLLLLLWFVLSVAQVFAISHLAESVFLFRALLPYGLAFYILAAAAAARLRPVPLRGSLLAALAVLAAFALHQRYTGQYPVYEWPHRPAIHPPVEHVEAARFIREHWREEDIAITPSTPFWLFLYELVVHDKPGTPAYFGAVTRSNIEFYHASAVLGSERPAFQSFVARHMQEMPPAPRRIWFAFTDWEREFLPGNPSQVWRWLDAHYTEVLHKPFRNIEVFLYQPLDPGNPVKAVERNTDNGVEAEVVYASGNERRPYRKTDPDSGLVPLSVEERRGRLALRFEDAPASDAVDLAKDPETRVVTFSLTNRSAQAVRCRVDFLPNDGILPLMALYETGEKPGMWDAQSLYNPEPPPASYELPVVATHIQDAPSPALQGLIPVARGPYRTLLYVLGRPGDPAQSRAYLDVGASRSPLFAAAAPASGAPTRWNWIAGNLLVSDGSKPVLLSLSARPAPGVETSWTDAAYLALRRADATPAPAQPGHTAVLWPGSIVVPGGAEVRRSARIDASAGRLDVWAYEAGEEGQVYHIYRAFRPETVLQPAPLQEASLAR